jgi:hypothetical protein
MITSLETMRPAHGIPHRGEFEHWRRNISRADQAAIRAAITAQIEGTTIVCSSFMPGTDWSGTPYQPIYDALGDERLAAMCFGLFVWEVVLAREEEWFVGRFELNDVQGLTYFRRGA